VHSRAETAAPHLRIGAFSGCQGIVGGYGHVRSRGFVESVDAGEKRPGQFKTRDRASAQRLGRVEQRSVGAIYRH
jgi:hypothetical protein